MLPDPIDFVWEDRIERDIAEDIESGEWEAWTSPLKDMTVESSWHLPEMTPEEWNRTQYQNIQAWGSQREFDDYWAEKMRRKADGIE